MLQVPVPEPGAVETQPLAELDHVQGRGVSRTGVCGVEQADGQEAEFGQRAIRRGHGRLLRTDILPGTRA